MRGAVPHRNDRVTGRRLCRGRGKIGQGSDSRKGALSLINLLKKLHREESGQDLIEYALIAALIAVASVAAMKGVATAIENEFTKVSGQLT